MHNRFTYIKISVLFLDQKIFFIPSIFITNNFKPNKSVMRYITLILTFLVPLTFYSQEQFTADELFLQARKIAFNEKDYTKSIKLAKEALEKSPDYTDIAIFLGRLYTWNDDIHSARLVFEDLEKKRIQEEDFY